MMFPGPVDQAHLFIRFHFVKKEETLRAVGERLVRLREFAFGQRPPPRH